MADVESGEWLNHSDAKELKTLALTIRDVRVALESVQGAAGKCAAACKATGKGDQAAFWENLVNQLDAAIHDASLKWNEDKCLEAIGYQR